MFLAAVRGETSINIWLGRRSVWPSTTRLTKGFGNQ